MVYSLDLIPRAVRNQGRMETVRSPRLPHGELASVERPSSHQGAQEGTEASQEEVMQPRPSESNRSGQTQDVGERHGEKPKAAPLVWAPRQIVGPSTERGASA
jgi:hypothetical protein